MKTIIALIIKFSLTLGAAWIAFSIFDNIAFSLVLLIAVIGTFLNYVIGDLFILPSFGNTFASIADGGLSVVTAFLLITLSYDLTTLISLIVFAIVIAVTEYFFHIYLLKVREIAPDHVPNILFKRNLDYSTETANELHLNDYNRNNISNGSENTDKKD